MPTNQKGRTVHKNKDEIAEVVENCTCPIGKGRPHKHLKLKDDAGTYEFDLRKGTVRTYSRNHFVPNLRANNMTEIEYEGKVLPD